jgi:CubicO group peptidase (beta-lactamase class C family)
MHPAIDKIDSFLHTCMRNKLFFGSVYLVGKQDRILTHGAVGSAVIHPRKIPMKKESVFDIASLTKPLCTALLSVLLVREKIFSLNDPVHRFFPEFKKSDKRKIRLRHLLTHTSGIPSWIPLYVHARNRRERITYLAGLNLKFSPGTRVLYGCLAYIVMSEIIRKTTGEGMDRLYMKLVTAPLKLKDTQFNPSLSKKGRIVATEKGNVFEKSLAGKTGKHYRGWIKEVLWGRVHDHNAYSMGGVSGNAGLFSTAEDLFALSKEILAVGKGLLSEQERKLFLLNKTRGLNEDRTIGWQMSSTRGSSSGSFLPISSIGHTGFTGVSLWLDPGKKRTLLFLTNRLHPKYRSFNMNAVRRSFHRIAARL